MTERCTECGRFVAALAIVGGVSVSAYDWEYGREYEPSFAHGCRGCLEAAGYTLVPAVEPEPEADEHAAAWGVGCGL